MSFKYLKDKYGNPIPFATRDSFVYSDDGQSTLKDRLNTLTTNVNTLYEDVRSTREIVENLLGGGSGEIETPTGPFAGVIKREDPTQNICLLSDDKGVVTSDYGYDYDKLAGILYTGEYSDYIKDGDYITLTTNDGATYKMYANIDTYYGEGETGKEIGHHIDFISDNLIYGSACRTNGSNNYSSTDRRTWRMNIDTTYSSNGNNNGVSTESSPFLANSTTHRGVEGGIIDKLNDYYVNNIPDGLKNYIVKKYHKIPTKYQSGTVLNYDNGSKWAEMPYLWIPYEKEVWGNNTYTGTTYESHMKQYHSFANISNFKVKADKKDTSSSWYWYTASDYSGNIYTFCSVGGDGGAINVYACDWCCGVPLCFRFNASPYEDKSTFDPFADVTLRSGTSNICLLTDNNGVISSDYGYTYEKLSGILQSGNYSNYIKDGDYITLTTADGATYKMYANIDTYYGTGETGKEIGHHIDFISDNLIYGSTSMTNGRYNYSNTDRRSWRMNWDTSNGNNNGKSTESSPFLANTTDHRGLNGGIIDKLNDYYVNNIPDGLKSYIVKKYHKVPTRYSSSSLKADNGSKWAEMPYLWIPYEKEVFGSNTQATSTYETHMKQYHSFSSISNFKVKADKKDTKTSYFWWTASAYSGNTKSFCSVYSDGSANYTEAHSWFLGVPLCFRFQ